MCLLRISAQKEKRKKNICMAFWNFGTNKITDNLKKKKRKKVRQTTWPNWTKICTWNFLILSRVFRKCRWAPRSPLRCLEKLQSSSLLCSDKQPGAPSQEAHGWGWRRDGGGGACWGGGINERRGRWSVYRAKIMRWDSEERRTSGALNRWHGDENHLLHGERETGAGGVPGGLPGTEPQR